MFGTLGLIAVLGQFTVFSMPHKQKEAPTSFKQIKTKKGHEKKQQQRRVHNREPVPSFTNGSGVVEVGFPKSVREVVLLGALHCEEIKEAMKAGRRWERRYLWFFKNVGVLN